MQAIDDFDARFSAGSDTIGKGGFGKVYLATEKSTGVQYAVKKFTNKYKENGVTSGFLREVVIYKCIDDDEASAGLFPKCIGYTITPKQRLVLEKFEKSLEDVKFSDFDQLVGVYKHLLKSLDVLHKHGIVHRDIKPHNCLYNSSENRAVLADLGSGRILTKLPQSGEITTDVCTMWWRPPEVFEFGATEDHDHFKFTPTVDIWSLGCTFLELAGCKLPGRNTQIDLDCYNNFKMWFDLIPIVVKPETLEVPASLGTGYSELIKASDMLDELVEDQGLDDQQVQSVKTFRNQYKELFPELDDDGVSDGVSVSETSGVRSRAAELLSKAYEIINQLRKNTYEFKLNQTRLELRNKIKSRTGNPVRDYIQTDLGELGFTRTQTEQIIELLDAMLKWNPDDRISAREALALPIFNSGVHRAVIPTVCRSYLSLEITRNPKYQTDDRYKPYMNLTRNYRLFLQKPRADVMANQDDINYKIYFILTEWLSEVHAKFRLVREVYFAGLRILDAFLEKKIVAREHLQLVGATAQFIACKYLEIFAPELNDYVYICVKAYTADQFKAMEALILSTIDLSIVAAPTLTEVIREVCSEEPLDFAQRQGLEFLSFVVPSAFSGEMVGKTDLEIALMLKSVFPKDAAPGALVVPKTKPRISEVLKSILPPGTDVEAPVNLYLSVYSKLGRHYFEIS